MLLGKRDDVSTRLGWHDCPELLGFDLSDAFVIIAPHRID